MCGDDCFPGYVSSHLHSATVFQCFPSLHVWEDWFPGYVSSRLHSATLFGRIGILWAGCLMLKNFPRSIVWKFGDWYLSRIKWNIEKQGFIKIIQLAGITVWKTVLSVTEHYKKENKALIGYKRFLSQKTSDRKKWCGIRIFSNTTILEIRYQVSLKKTGVIISFTKTFIVCKFIKANWLEKKCKSLKVFTVVLGRKN